MEKYTGQNTGIRKRKTSVLIAVLQVILLAVLPSVVGATVYTVNSTAVTNTGTGTSGTLPYCVAQVNAGAGGDTINFSVSGTISITAAVTLNKKVTIDGTTAPGYAGVPLVQVANGASLTDGINVFTSGCVVKGLSVTGFSTTGIQITASGDTVILCYLGVTPAGTASANGTGITIGGNNNVIGGVGLGNVMSGNTMNGLLINTGTANVVKGNMAGTNAAGTAAIPNLTGMVIFGEENMVGGTGTGEGNLISGNSGKGMQLSDSENIAQGNIIGMNAAGNAALANGTAGILVSSGPNTIGGTAAGAGNYISGNLNVGIGLQNSATGIIIQGNTIGMNMAGTAAVANGSTGISLGVGSNVVGGTVAGAGNYISGNTGSGISASSAGNTIQGNTIGLNAAGTAAVHNAGGISLNSGSNNTVIGGTVAGAGNIISGNTGSGISASSAGNTIQGNTIGLNAAGTAAVHNAGGISLISGSNNTVIGGTVAGAGNIISGNTGIGISVNSTGDTIMGNIIGMNATGTAAVPNTGQGITLNAGGINTIIGGTTAGAGNYISGNATAGIGVSSSGNVIQGNTIGLNMAGTSAVGNGTAGISLGAASNTVGGSMAGAGNVISGNATGIAVNAAGNTIQGNTIGLNAAGTAAVANGTGVSLSSISNNTVIGGTVAGAGNIISGNTNNGITVNSMGDTILGNIIGMNAAGTSALPNTNGISINGTGTAIIGGSTSGAGNYISGNSVGLSINSGGNAIKGNTIGTNITGTAAVPNSAGIAIFSAANTIGGTAAGEGNLISGNTGSGIQVSGTGNTIQGNIIGMNAAGTAALANSVGVAFTTGPNTIGGTVAGACNYISGNTNYGISVQNSGTGITIQGNVIGMNVAGTAAVANGAIGVSMSAGSNTVGGSVAGAGNVISGNPTGISASSNGNTIQGNTIGLNAAGTAAAANGTGIFLNTAATNTIVGGAAGGAGNIISGNTGNGITVSSTGDTIMGNTIGMNKAGTVAIANAAGIVVNASATTIGGTTAGQANIIAGNANGGVVVAANSATGVRVSGNSIYGNGSLGIDLGNDGVTLNDLLDPDLGANGLLNFPVITSVVQGGGNTTISGTYDGAASATFTIELFNNTVSDKSGYGQGKTYIGTTTVTTDGTGHGTFSTAIAGSYTLISSTATDASNNTSEFSMTGPSFVNTSPQAFTICVNGTANIASLLHVSDVQLGQTLTWSQSTAPSHGALSFAGATAASGSSDISPGGTINYVPAGSYLGLDTFTIQATDGTATVTTVLTVTVTTLPAITSIGNNGPICQGTILTLNSAATGGYGSFNYSWTGPNAFSATGFGPSILSAPMAASGIYTLVATDANNCIATGTNTTAVTVTPGLPLITGVPYVVAGSTVMLSDGIAGGSWGTPSTGIATISNSGVVSGISAGRAVINYTASGCPATTATITVVPQGVLCVGASVQLSDTVAGGTWTSMAPGYATVNATTGIVTGVVAGSTTIKHTAMGYLRTYSVTINPITAITGNSALCGGKTMTLYNATSGGGLWASDDNIAASVSNAGLVAAAYSATNVLAGIYFITPAGCVSEKTITVNAALPVTGNTSACQGQTTLLANALAGGTWSSSNAGNATVGQATGMVTGAAAGSPVISYGLPSGCISVATVTVSPLAPITGNTTVCNGQTLTVYNTTTGGGAWSLSPTQTPAISLNSSGVITGLSAGMATISFTTPMGCITSKTITVYPSDPLTGITTVCVGQATALSDDLAGGTWNTSNPGYATVTGSGSVSGVAAGAPVIKYTLPTGCISSATVTVHALSPITGSTTACAGRTTQLYNTTTGGGVWSTSTSSVATVNVSGLLSTTTTGAANVIFTTTQGCVTNKTITVSSCREADSTTALTSVATGIADIILFPNPNSGAFNVKGTLAATEDAEVSIEITDMLGQVVYRNTFVARGGNINEQLQLVNAVANSMYLVNVRSGAESKVFHIVIEK